MGLFFPLKPSKMGAKKDTKTASKAPAKAPKKKEGSGGGKAKKKKWSKGKTRDKLYKEVPTYKLITPSIVSERLKVRGSLARKALIELHAKGLIKQIVNHSAQMIYTRVTKDNEDEEPVEEVKETGKKG